MAFNITPVASISPVSIRCSGRVVAIAAHACGEDSCLVTMTQDEVRTGNGEGVIDFVTSDPDFISKLKIGTRITATFTLTKLQ